MDWANWPQFVHEITVAFSPITEEEQARKLLKGLNQTGNVQNYVQRFSGPIVENTIHVLC